MKRIMIFLCAMILLVCSAGIVSSAMSLDPYFDLHSLEEYNEYWKEHEAPEKFVTYEQLSFLGEYRSFSYPLDDMHMYVDNYGYSLMVTPEENPRQIYVEVYDDLTALAYLNEVHKVTPSGYDLREDNRNGIYRHDDNLGYRYLYNGKLRIIYLKIDDVVLAIQSDDGGWDKFDPNENHVICRLLNQKTASLAYQEFVRLFKGDQTPLVPDLNLKPAEKDNQTLAIAVSTGVGAVAIGTAAAVIVTKKKKAKK